MKAPLSEAAPSTRSLVYKRYSFDYSPDEQEDKALQQRWLWCSCCEFVFSLGEALYSLDESAPLHSVDYVLLQCPHRDDSGAMCTSDQTYFHLWTLENPPRKYHSEYPDTPKRDQPYEGFRP